MKLAPSISRLAAALALLLFFVSGTFGAKILSISFFSSKSHKIVVEPLYHALAERGHQVTVVTPVLSSKKPGKNYREVLTMDMEDLFADEMDFAANVFEMRAKGGSFASGFVTPFMLFGEAFASICRKSYALPHVQEIMKEKFDLVLFSPFFNECLYGLVHKMNATLVLTTQMVAFPWMTANLGIPAPTSFVPSIFAEYSDRMTFGQRFMNMLVELNVAATLKWYYYPKMEKVYREAYGDEGIPRIDEIEKTATLLIENSDYSFTRPRPTMPGIVSAGGLFVKPPKNLTGEFKEFADDAKDGFILFSMGSALKGSDMPDRIRKIFLNVFSKLKQRVLWKWETETMDDLPANVKLSKWLPQPDVLAHKNIKMFITHGGHGSTVEAIYHGVPLIGIPMFGDQISNMKTASRLGFAIALEFSELTEELLEKTIKEILKKKSYSENAKQRSIIFKDRPEDPLEKAVYWVEYALRHPGAPHLRSAARDLSTIEYYQIDVIAVLALIVLVPLVALFLIVRKIAKCICELTGKCKQGGKSPTGKDNNNKKKKKQ